MLILALARTLIRQHEQIVAGAWPRNANVPVRGRTLGIVGLGRIGKAVALRARAFGMRVIIHEPMPDANFCAQQSIPLLPLEEVIREADFLTLHLPLTPGTRHMINAKTLGWMKPTAYLVNTSRGGLIHEPDLYDALSNKRIAGAGLDVFDEEPPGQIPLTTLDNVVLTAHTAGVDLKSRDDMALSAAQAIVDLSRGKWPTEKVVNPEVRGKFKW